MPVAPDGKFVHTREGTGPTKECAESFGHVTGDRAQLRPTLRLESNVQLADIVECCQDAESSQPDVSETPSGQSRQPLAPDRQSQQCLDNGGHVRTVIRKRVPLEQTCGIGWATEFAPESSRFAPQVPSRMRFCPAVGEFCHIERG